MSVAPLLGLLTLQPELLLIPLIPSPSSLLRLAATCRATRDLLFSTHRTRFWRNVCIYHNVCVPHLLKTGPWLVTSDTNLSGAGVSRPHLPIITNALVSEAIDLLKDDFLFRHGRKPLLHFRDLNDAFTSDGYHESNFHFSDHYCVFSNRDGRIVTLSLQPDVPSPPPYNAKARFDVVAVLGPDLFLLTRRDMDNDAFVVATYRVPKSSKVSPLSIVSILPGVKSLQLPLDGAQLQHTVLPMYLLAFAQQRLKEETTEIVLLVELIFHANGASLGTTTPTTLPSSDFANIHCVHGTRKYFLYLTAFECRIVARDGAVFATISTPQNGYVVGAMPRSGDAIFITLGNHYGPTRVVKCDINNGAETLALSLTAVRWAEVVASPSNSGYSIVCLLAHTLTLL